MAVKAKVKTDPKRKSQMPGKGLLGPVKIMLLWQYDPIPPDILSSGSNWVLIGGPVSDEELTRDYCTITHTPPGGTATPIASGDINDPFDGSCFLRSNLASGTHTFTAEASYSEGDNPAPQSVQITLP